MTNTWAPINFVFMKMIVNFNSSRKPLLLATLMASTMKQLVSLLLVVSLVGYGVSSLLNLHIHVLPDGTIVAHSHPIPDEEGGHKHKHSHKEFEAIKAAVNALTTGGLTSHCCLQESIDSSSYNHAYIESPDFCSSIPTSSERSPPVSPLS